MADGFVPPKGAQENARRGLELREEFKRGGTMVGVARARDLSNGRSLPLKTINRMVSYFARHEVDKKGKDWGNASNPSRGYIAWLLWGGDAGKTWADSIAEREKKKDKSMTTDLAHSYAQIIKQEKQDDGTLLVYGKATDDALDIDEQICDAAWLDKAMPDWFKTGGNIREQHSNIAAGVAKELDSTTDGHYISALIVDPVSVKKVETGVLKGFSIGIRAPRIVRDTKAANGRIIDGQIVEISLVDRPANPNAKLMLAKSDNGGDLEQVEEFIEKEQDRDEAGRFGSGGGDSSSSDRGGSDKPEGDKPEVGWNSTDQQDLNDVVSANDDVMLGLDNLNDEDSDDFTEDLTDADDEAIDEAFDSLKEANDQIEAAYNAKTDDERASALENAVVRMDDARTALLNADSKTIQSYADDIEDAASEIEQMIDVYNERDSKSVKTTTTKERAMARTKKITKSMHEDEDKAVAEKPSKEDLMKQYEECKMNYMAAEKALDECKSMCKEAGMELDEDEEKELKPVGESAEEETEEGSKPEAAEEEVEEAEGKKPIEKSEKCLECGCDQPSDAHGRDDVSTATMVGADEDLSKKTITAIIDKAVKSAKDAITTEVTSYQEEIDKLSAELATARTKAVQGGPKRSVIKPAVIAELGDLLQKAAEYRAKSAVTDDKDLARGYKELASDFEAKALAVQANK